MPALPQQIGVAVDVAGCPNRCRHCYLGSGPNDGLPRDLLGEVADALWTWSRPGEAAPLFERVDVLSWYREPDFSDDYRQLHDLCVSLSRRPTRRYELLSMWRLARDPGYAAWAAAVGPRVCQMSLFGMAERTDHFHRRRGAFDDVLTATERLLSAGMIPRWQVFLTKLGLSDLDGIMGLVDSLRLRQRVADLGGEFVIFCHPPGPDGDGWGIEDIRIDSGDLDLIPESLLESTRAHLGGIPWEAESALTEKIRSGMAVEPYVPAQTWLFINATCDVFCNYGELDPYWRLGNFWSDPVDALIRVFETETPPGLHAAFNAERAELADRHGRRDSSRLYSPGDLVSRWLHLHVRDSAPRGG
jgi:hypothetical protein